MKYSTRNVQQDLRKLSFILEPTEEFNPITDHLIGEMPLALKKLFTLWRLYRSLIAVIEESREDSLVIEEQQKRDQIAVFDAKANSVCEMLVAETQMFFNLWTFGAVLAFKKGWKVVWVINVFDLPAMKVEIDPNKITIGSFWN